MLRQEVLKLYRDILRTIKQIPDDNSRNELKEWARHDFRMNKHKTDELTIKNLMQHGRQFLGELKNSLKMSGITGPD